MSSYNRDLQETLRQAIEETLMDPEGAGSDLSNAYPIDNTWMEVDGNLDLEHLASHIIHVLGLEYQYASQYSPKGTGACFQSRWGSYRDAVDNVKDAPDNETVIVRRIHSTLDDEVV